MKYFGENVAFPVRLPFPYRTATWIDHVEGLGRHTNRSDYTSRRMPTGPLIVSYFLDHQWNSCNHKLHVGLTAAENGMIFMKLWLRADHAHAMR